MAIDAKISEIIIGFISVSIFLRITAPRNRHSTHGMA
jgi:hypothetical protein